MCTHVCMCVHVWVCVGVCVGVGVVCAVSCVCWRSQPGARTTSQTPSSLSLFPLFPFPAQASLTPSQALSLPLVLSCPASLHVLDSLRSGRAFASPFQARVDVGICRRLHSHQRTLAASWCWCVDHRVSKEERRTCSPRCSSGRTPRTQPRRESPSPSFLARHLRSRHHTTAQDKVLFVCVCVCLCE